MYDNGKPQRITEDITNHPISLVIVIQANSAVERFIPQIQKLGNLVEAQLLGETGEVAVLEFDHRFQWLLPFTSEPDKLNLALKKIKAGSLDGRGKRRGGAGDQRVEDEADQSPARGDDHRGESEPGQRDENARGSVRSGFRECHHLSH